MNASAPVPVAELELLKIADVADQLQLSERTVRDLIYSGRLPVIKIGRLTRIDPADLARFVRACRVS